MRIRGCNKETPYSVLRDFSTSLYHYTTIASFTEILKNQTIRFNRLDKVNDLIEAQAHGYENAQQLVFASCWTESSQESIPLWKMYSELNGVRIKMPTLMFAGRCDNIKSTTDDAYYELPLFKDGEQHSFDIRRKKGGGFHGNNVHGPSKIKYVPDPSNLYIKIEGEKNISLSNLGLAKHDVWYFEQEIRYRLFAFFSNLSGEFISTISPDALKDEPVTTEYVDIPVDPTALDDMEVMMGPKTTSADLTIVESLVEKFAPKVKVVRSAIKIR